MRLAKEELHRALEERHGKLAQEKFDNACIGIAGLGGLGSNIAVHLARLGIGRMVLADFDMVTITNLNRQHYTMADLGQFKTEAMLRQLKQINPYLNYEIHNGRITSQNAARLFEDCTVVCEAFDRPDQKAMLIESLLSGHRGVRVVAGSGMAGYGSANSIVTKKRMNRLYICGDETSDISDGLGLMAPRVAVCAAHQAVMAMRIILECV